MAKPVVAVVAAAGVGARFGGPIPKQIRKMSGQALISWSVEALANGGCTHAVIVIKPEMKPRFTALLKGAPIPVQLVEGGASRQESVYLGLKAIQENPKIAETEIILVHDAVRPLVPAEVVTRVIDAVKGGAVAVTPVIPITDSVRQENLDGTSQPIDRATLRAIQTPQGFDAQTLFAAHEAQAASGGSFTDDVTCCEAQGHPVTLVEGAKISMKVTEQEDLAALKAMLKLNKQKVKSGLNRLWGSK